MTSAERYVLDSYAILAFLEDEPGAEEVEDILAASARGEAQAWLSIINFGEVLYITERERGLSPAHRIVALIDQLPIRVIDADRERTFAAAHVKAHHALSYADAFAVALAVELEARVVTGDPEFRKTETLAPVLWLGREAQT